jgi:cobyrinic acid a,c-diamide synthase
MKGDLAPAVRIECGHQGYKILGAATCAAGERRAATETKPTPVSRTIPLSTSRRGRGLILAAPASGSGKTLVAAGLARYLRRRGLRIATAKAGPDFIDPTFHAAATGQPCLNLDIWAMRPGTLARLVAETEGAADIVLCEGVMGLFDGTGPEGETGSTADVARLIGWPVVLVVDARGQGASVAALLRGFALHQPSLPLAGVIFNRVSSDRHAALLENAVARHLPRLTCFGALPLDPALVLPSRHLGLVPAHEDGEADRVIDHCATRIGAAVDVDRLTGLARSSTLAAGAGAAPMPPLGQRIAVARDQAFCFAYPTVLEGWRRQGVELTFFSPLADEPPEGTADSVYLPGGYPELWADRLASAVVFIAGLRKAADDKKPIYGECGGYMVLGNAMVNGNGCTRRMAGLLPLVTSFSDRHLHLGYRCVRLHEDGPLGARGSGFRGHEFHYAKIVQQDAADPLFWAADAAGTEIGACGLRRGSVFGSFIHLIDRYNE